MYGYDLIVKDEEFESVGKELSSFGDNLEDTIEKYRSIIEHISASALVSGEVHEALLLYSDYIMKLRIISRRIGEKFTRLVSNYITEIENADDYLYDAGISNIARDFSDKEYEHLQRCLDDPWCSITDSIGDWIYSKVVKVADFFDWTGIRAWLNKLHRFLLDYNDETAQGLKLLFESVYAIDLKYGRSIPGSIIGAGNYYTCYFSSVLLTMCSLDDMLKEMADIIDPQKESFTVSSIQNRLGGKYDELLERYNKLIAIPELNSYPTINEISDFASQPWAGLFFADFTCATIMFVEDIGGYEAFKMCVFNAFDIAKTVLFSEQDYEKYVIKRQLLDVLEDMSQGGYNYSKSDEKEMVDDCKTFLKYVKKYGKAVYGYMNKHRMENGKLILDGRTIEAERFRDFLDGVGGAEKIIKYGDKAADFLSKLFMDYSKGLDIINSYEKNYLEDERISKCIGEIKKLYNKEFEAWVDELFQEAVEMGEDWTMKLLKKVKEMDGVTSVFGRVASVVNVVSTIDESIDIVGEVTGLGTEARSMKDALIYYQLYRSSNSAYEKAVEKFQKVDLDDKEYEILANDLNNCFEFNKKNMIEMFEAMSNASIGLKKSYYHYCAKQAESLSMRNTSQPKILTYEEFVALDAA